MHLCNCGFAELRYCQVKSPIVQSASPSHKSANLLYSGQVTETALSASLTRQICKFAMLRSSHWNCIVRKSNSSNPLICYLQVNRINFASCKFKLQLEQSIYHETPWQHSTPDKYSIFSPSLSNTLPLIHILYITTTLIVSKSFVSTGGHWELH